MKQQVLVIEDEESIQTLLQFNLEKAGYEVICASDGASGLEYAKRYLPDIIILDLMLPELDGVEVCKNLRQAQIMVPILMLTAKDDEFDKVLGLELGADDYMTKPFSPREVIARIKAILRRTRQNPQNGEAIVDKLNIGELVIYPENYEAFFKKQLLELTPKEFELLVYLVKNKGRVLTRDQLLNAIWNYDFVGDTRIVDVHISHLREKIEHNTRNPVYIKTIRGLGYKMEEPQEDGQYTPKG